MEQVADAFGEEPSLAVTVTVATGAVPWYIVCGDKDNVVDVLVCALLDPYDKTTMSAATERRMVEGRKEWGKQVFIVSPYVIR
jgi:hypothetical protein